MEMVYSDQNRSNFLPKIDEQMKKKIVGDLKWTTTVPLRRLTLEQLVRTDLHRSKFLRMMLECLRLEVGFLDS